MTAKTIQITTQSFQPDRLSPVHVAWLAVAIFAVSADFGALMPVLPAWLNTLMLGAVILVVAALVAEHTPVAQRARRFAWLGAMSLLGFLLGPALTVLAEWIAPWTGVTANAAAAAAQGVVVLSAALGAMIILGVVVTLPASAKASASVQADTAILDHKARLRCGHSVVRWR